MNEMNAIAKAVAAALLIGSVGALTGAGYASAAAPTPAVSPAANADKKDADKKEEEPKGEPVDVDKLPKAVAESVKKDMPGARITKAAKLEDGNYFLDDVKVGKKTWDVTVTPKGKIVKKVENKDND